MYFLHYQPAILTDLANLVHIPGPAATPATRPAAPAQLLEQRRNMRLQHPVLRLDHGRVRIMTDQRQQEKLFLRRVDGVEGTPCSVGTGRITRLICRASHCSSLAHPVRLSAGSPASDRLRLRSEAMRHHR